MDLTFDSFWQLYPRKQDKKKARTAFSRLTMKKKRFAIEDKPQERYKNTEKQFIPLPTTYIHGERWEDEIIKQEATIKFPVPGSHDWVKFAAGRGIGTIPGESQFHFENRVKTEVLNAKA